MNEMDKEISAARTFHEFRGKCDKEEKEQKKSVKSNSHYRILRNRPLTHRRRKKISNRSGKWNCLIVAAATLSAGRSGRRAVSPERKGAFLEEQSAKVLNTFGSVKRNILEFSRAAPGAVGRATGAREKLRIKMFTRETTRERIKHRDKFITATSDSFE